MPTNTDQTFRFATNVFDADGTDKVYDISFAGGYISPANVIAMSGKEDPVTGLLVDVQPHVVSFIDTPPGNRVKVTPIPVTGRKLIIMRSTDISGLLVKFSDDKLLTGRNLDLNSTQFLMAIQEIMDGLRANNIIVEQSVNTVVALDEIVKNIYEQVMALLAAGGIVSVTPRTWSGTWTGAQETDEEWELVGADVEDAGFYDTYVNGYGLDPEKDFEIILGATPADTKIRFKTVPVPGSKWFTVLRGYARPYTGPKPITQADLRVRIVESDGPVFYPDVDSEYGLVRCNDPTATEVRLEEIPAVADTKLGDGSYMSFVQKGGPVTIIKAPGVVLNVPEGCAPKTRALHSTITITCEFADGNVWLLSGDLAKEE